jgi:hypothetical protein
LVGGLAPASRRHVLNDDVWASGNIFAQKRSHGPRPQIRRSRRRTAQNNSNRFVLIERDLSQRQPGVQFENRDEQNNDIHFHIFRSLARIIHTEGLVPNDKPFRVDGNGPVP